MTSLTTSKTKYEKIIQVMGIGLFVFIWVGICWYCLHLLGKINDVSSGFGPIDASRRITSPDQKYTAILARSYASFLDLNFALYITDDNMAEITDSSEQAYFIKG
ncbi:MAG: hypothetical protein ACOYYS_18570 [Chloroflexota bacterium]